MKVTYCSRKSGPNFFGGINILMTPSPPVLIRLLSFLVGKTNTYTHSLHFEHSKALLVCARVEERRAARSRKVMDVFMFTVGSELMRNLPRSLLL